MGLRQAIQRLRQRGGAWIVGREVLFETLQEIATTLQAIATIIALIIGGFWTYKLTSQFRETVPKLAIKQDVSSWTLHDGSTLLRVDSTLTNAGKVQIKRVNGTMIVWRLLPETKEQVADYSAGKLFFNCKEVSKAAVPGCVPEQGLNVPSSSKTQFTFGDRSGLEPGESVSYWRYLHLDADVRTIEVYTEVQKPEKADEWVFDQTFNLKRETGPSHAPNNEK